MRAPFRMSENHHLAPGMTPQATPVFNGPA